MNPLDQTIAEIQMAYAGVTDIAVFEGLLAQEKRGKRRKVLKRWLKERIKAAGKPPADLSLHEFEMFEDDGSSTTEGNRAFFKPPKDKITGIPIIG